MSSTSELVFVVDITSFTGGGFTASSSYEGRRVDIEFSEKSDGLRLSKEMCNRVGLEKGSGVTILVEEDEKVHSIESVVAEVGETLRFGSPELYYTIGRTGGGVLVIRKTEP
jgi:hypothetical protein